MDRVRITRDQLYAEVWAEPATKVAAREALLKDCQQRAATWSEARQIQAFLDAVIENAPHAGDPTTSRGEVVAFLRAQMKAHHQHALDMSGVKLDP